MSSRILVVEDEVSLARLTARVLAEEGFETRIEHRGDLALESARAFMPDVVVLDVALPGLDGLSVCRRLRSNGLQMPVVMLTARDEIPDRVRGLDAGADDYLVKPFAFEELLARLRAHLRREGGGQPIRVADLTLDPATRLVHRGGREIRLTAQEFRLLELFMRHPNLVQPRQRILDHVWGYRAAPASNVVDIYVHYLREKLEAGGAPRLLHTVRGAGYVMRP